MIPRAIGQSAVRKSGRRERVGKEAGRKIGRRGLTKLGMRDRRATRRMMNARE